MKKLKPVLIIVVVLAALGGGAAWYLHLLPFPGRTAEAAAPPPPPPPVPVRVSEIVTNLADPGQQRYIQVAMTVEMSNSADAAKMNHDMAAVNNDVILTARRLTSAYLGSPTGVQGFKKLLATAFDKVVGKPKAVRTIYFTQFVIQ